jgi:hypothetical protein
MPGLSPRSDRFLTIAVLFTCGAVIGLGIWAYRNYGEILGAVPHAEWKWLLGRALLWGGIIGAIFACTSAKNDSQWLE